MLFPIIRFILILQTVSWAAASLENTCKKAAGSNYSFCVTSLQVVPEAHTADAKGLAVIATNLILANFSNNIDAIDEKLNGKELANGRVRAALELCSDSYEMGVSEVRVALERMKSDGIVADPDLLSGASEMPGECEGAFRGVGEKSVMAKENDLISRLITLTQRIIALENEAQLIGSTV